MLIEGFVVPSKITPTGTYALYAGESNPKITARDGAGYCGYYRVQSRKNANIGTFTGFCIIGYIFSVFCYPETKGISVDETQEIFADGFGIQKSADMRREKIALAKEMRNEA
jgi:hypothetical protein